MSPQLLRLLSLLRHPDADRVEDVFPPARQEAILAAVLEGPGARASRRDGFALPRRRVGLPVSLGIAAAALAVTLVVVLRSAPAVHAAGVSFHYPKHGPDSGYIVATVTDPFAAQASLDAAFQQAGLDLKVTLVAASPSAVGTVVFIDESAGAPPIEPLTGGTCVTGGGGPGQCPIGVKIPRDFTGSGYITLGRPAQPGEDFESANSAFAPGESLHCSGLIGKTYADAQPVLAGMGITVQSPPTANAYITDAIPIRAGVIELDTSSTPLTASVLASQSRMYDAGC